MATCVLCVGGSLSKMVYIYLQLEHCTHSLITVNIQCYMRMYHTCTTGRYMYCGLALEMSYKPGEVSLHCRYSEETWWHRSRRR